MKLRDYLKEQQMNQRKFSKLVDISPSTLCYYIKGVRFPSAQTVKRIFEATGGKVSANDFFHSQSNLSENEINSLNVNS